METQVLSKKPNIDYRSTIDTSRPFRSVKEAIAIFGERFLAAEIYSPKPYTSPKQETSWKFTPPRPEKPREPDDHHDHTLVNSLKKLEAELEETKVELKLLKERESETEVALASLNAELHKNMSKMAKAEAAAAAKAARSAGFEGGNGEVGVREEEKRRDLIVRMEQSPTLAQILSLGEKRGYFGGRNSKKMKKKPIIPLVGDLFSRKKGSSTTTLQHPLYSSSQMSLN